MFEPLKISSVEERNLLALDIFKFQASENKVYKDYLNHLKINPTQVASVDQIPFLPISFFKSHDVQTRPDNTKIFLSSGTGGNRSKHLVQDISIYEKSITAHFNHRFGDFTHYVHLALVPNYLEQGDSSLIHQINYFIENGDSEGGFYLYNFDELFQKLTQLKEKNKPVVLWGVTFALLDFIKEHTLSSSNLTIIETGGMKGRGKELIREELHTRLQESFPKSIISSEYGMTELFSQAYWNPITKVFNSHLSLSVFCRPDNDPLGNLDNNKHGALNIMDLNNWSTCSFIASEDLGICLDGGFQVLGRMDHSETRGCSLMYV